MAKTNVNEITAMSEMQAKIGAVRRTEQEILDVIHQICITHGLRYSLAYGTLLGAVRHKGFVPWDDDIDIMMPREDYNTLLQIWNDMAPSGYLILNGDTSVDWSGNFTKIVKDKTTFLQTEEDRGKDFHKGIFIDIFPGDRLAPGKIRRILQYCACAINLLYSRGYSSKSGGVVEAIERVLLIVPKKYHCNLRQKAQFFISRWNTCTESQYFFPCTIRDCKKYYNPKLFESFTMIEFGEKCYNCTMQWNSYLTVCYGDYMQLPPEEERSWTHHPIVIDFNHNYEELDVS